MPRAHTTELLKRAYEAGDGDAALALLEQSMALGHRRIALLRYLQAQHLHAALDARHHEYVHEIAARMSPQTLARLVREARVRAARAAHHDEGEVTAARSSDWPIAGRA
jgi:hypothetical protein